MFEIIKSSSVERRKKEGLAREVSATRSMTMDNIKYTGQVCNIPARPPRSA